MTASIGILLAFVALFSWGFGDFFIQKATRIIGIWKALFCIGVVGCITLFPWIRGDLASINLDQWPLIGLLVVVVLFAALFDFEALRSGKMAVVEPLIGIELPITIALSMVFLKERPTGTQFVLMFVVFIGIVLVATGDLRHLHYHKRWLEKGVIWAGLGGIGMALTSFLIGVSSREMPPLLVVWLAHSSLAFLCGLYLIVRKELGTLIADIRKNPMPVIAQSILDNIAWSAYAISTTIIPISIAITISESYIALAAVLGIVLNHEKLRPHQTFGAILAIGSVIVLSALTAG